ncbi:hypothetical protein FIBSPDRAFT_915182 [Athelia psychrophila]|uniref:DUF1996 domain-containing protein n=1 Tax=Athelia psychrophila TaxID=1759441 RepID=A0A167UMZ1_9AGAM|nr:hypothetical protein FIBSPDRAFT_915182 [Fibularhizoctonia sp. CBS 109695]
MSFSMLASLIFILNSSTFASAWFRVACTTPLVSKRLDPITSPGVIGSTFVNTGFAPNSSYNDLVAGSCTSCEVTEDKSSYYFPKLYFQDPNNGSFEDVSNGGVLIYYLNRGNLDVSNGGSGLKAFPPGLKMISGNPVSRSIQQGAGTGNQTELAELAVQYKCYGFPNTTCEAGLLSTVYFPSCWDGVNLDSPDHTSHVAFLSKLTNSDCPSTHPVGLQLLYYQITWDVNDFADRWTAPAWPCVYSTGDPTGYLSAAYFENGWNITAQKNAITYCNNPNDATGSGDTAACPYLTVTSSATADNCKIDAVIDEPVDGVLSQLPGCNPIQPGPQNATLYSTSNCPI